MREITIIPSKSDAHRALICAALAEMLTGDSCEILCDGTSRDIEATRKCLTCLGLGDADMFCGESGSTLRFLLPVMGAVNHTAVFHCEGRLAERPLSPLYEELQNHGCSLSPQGSNPIIISGQLQAGTFTIPGNVSSQYISGLLFALPLLAGDSRIIITGNLESGSYVEMTLRTLQMFGIEILREADGYTVPGGQIYRAPKTYQVEGDWSNGCFWLAAGALVDGGLTVRGLLENSMQGDKEILHLLKRFGAEVICEEKGITVFPGTLRGIDIDASQIPDMVPILAVAACAAEGKTVIRNAGRLRIKESDRLASVSRVLRGLGAEIEELSDGLVITGRSLKEHKYSLKGGPADSWNDHRIAMMAAIASLLCEEKVKLTGANAVEKSYPGFFEDLKALGLSTNIERI